MRKSQTSATSGLAKTNSVGKRARSFSPPKCSRRDDRSSFIRRRRNRVLRFSSTQYYFTAGLGRDRVFAVPAAVGARTSHSYDVAEIEIENRRLLVRDKNGTTQKSLFSTFLDERNVHLSFYYL